MTATCRGGAPAHAAARARVPCVHAPRARPVPAARVRLGAAAAARQSSPGPPCREGRESRASPPIAARHGRSWEGRGSGEEGGSEGGRILGGEGARGRGGAVLGDRSCAHLAPAPHVHNQAVVPRAVAARRRPRPSQNESRHACPRRRSLARSAVLARSESLHL